MNLPNHHASHHIIPGARIGAHCAACGMSIHNGAIQRRCSAASACCEGGAC